MRRLSRLAIVLAAIVIFAGGTALRARAQFDETAFQRAAALAAAGKAQDAVNAYTSVAHDNQTANRELAAEALYRAGAYAASDAFGSTPAAQHDGQVQGLQLWKQVREQYAGTRADHKITDPQAEAPCGAYVQLLEKAGPAQDVTSEYNRIVRENQRTNRNLAAQALYQAGVYLQGAAGTTDEKRAHQDNALQLWTQLKHEFADTPAGHEVTDARPGAPDGRIAALEAAIDRRNSKDWKYQIVDAMVRATGRNPSFSYALALILIAVIVKAITWPLMIKQYRSMRQMQRMQPHIKELQKKYKGQELNQKTMELYKQHGVNPFAGCLPMLLQLPFLIWVYNTIREYQYAFAHGHFLWVGSSLAKEYPGVVAPNLAQPDMPLLVIYTISNYVAMRLNPAPDPQQQQQQNTMALMSSAIFFWMFIQWKFPSAFLLYWMALNLLNIWQQYEYVIKPKKADRLAAEANGTGTLQVSETPNKNGAAHSDGEKKPIAPATPPARVRPRKKKR